MDPMALALAAAFFAAAMLYASVGHAGASGYLAAMGLLGVAPKTMKPTALAPNILVASIGTLRFAFAARVRWRALAPFVAASIPMAFVGGALVLPGELYRPLVGIVLLFAAFRLFGTAARLGRRDPSARPGGAGPDRREWDRSACGPDRDGRRHLPDAPPHLRRLGRSAHRGRPVGGLHPLQLCGRAGRQLASVRALPPSLPLWLLTVAVGGATGAELAARRFGSPAIRRALAAVLAIAGLKLIFLR